MQQDRCHRGSPWGCGPRLCAGTRSSWINVVSGAAGDAERNGAVLTAEVGVDHSRPSPELSGRHALREKLPFMISVVVSRQS